MGVTAENIAERYGITREEQDKMAEASHAKAANAWNKGWAQEEITPIKTIVYDKEENEHEVLVNKDDGIREGVSAEKLSKLKPAFRKGGSVTAGNSSQLTDGGAVIVLAKRSAAKRLGCKIYGRMLSYSAVGVPPEIMGVGPAFAIPPALKQAGLTTNDIDIFEINEAFAAQAAYCVKKLNIPMEKVNKLGGAIAIGHPLGMTGSRQLVTLMHQLHREGKKYGLVSMCVGTGMGACGVFENEWF